MDGPYDTSADAFYEEIEAPKFVDLTDKNPIRVDDRYWFCSRVGMILTLIWSFMILGLLR